MKTLIIALVLFGISSAHADCVVGSLRVVGRDLMTCQNGVLGGRSYERGVNSASLRDFLIEYGSRADVVASFSAGVGTTPQDAIDFFNQGIRDEVYVSRVFADSDSQTEYLQQFADHFNELNGFAPAIQALQQREAEQNEELRRSEPVDYPGILQLTRNNQSRFNETRSRCQYSNGYDGDLQAIEAHFPIDGFRQQFVPLSFVPDNGRSESGTLYFVGPNRELESRRIFSRDGKSYWIGGDGVEYEVEFSEVSIDHLTRVRNFGTPADMSSDCYLVRGLPEGPGALRDSGEASETTD